MEKMLTEICEYLNNYFVRSKLEGDFVITGGELEIEVLKAGQYFRIVGSVLNDGVHLYPATDLNDEEFTGEIWSMAVPAAVIDLAREIAAWVEQYGAVGSPAMSPYSSESFGNYSYSKSAGAAGSGGANGNTWQGVFAARLAPYRRMRNII